MAGLRKTLPSPAHRRRRRSKNSPTPPLHRQRRRGRETTPNCAPTPLLLTGVHHTSDRISHRDVTATHYLLLSDRTWQWADSLPMRAVSPLLPTDRLRALHTRSPPLTLPAAPSPPLALHRRSVTGGSRIPTPRRRPSSLPRGVNLARRAWATPWRRDGGGGGGGRSGRGGFVRGVSRRAAADGRGRRRRNTYRRRDDGQTAAAI